MKTIAIVIGNSAYFEGDELQNSVKDSQAIKDVFERLGYDVFYYENMKDKDCPQILKCLKDKIGQYDANIFFYSGHGFEKDGENYLVGTECQLNYVESKYDLQYNSIALSDLMSIYSEHPNKINIVILDACRKDFKEKGVSNSGFKAMNAPQGTYIAYSTSSSRGASDGSKEEGHSPYAKALLEYLGREYLAIEDLFKKVRKSVYTWTEGKQVPWEHTSLIGDFYFNEGQEVFALNIPYSENVVKDSEFEDDSHIGKLITELRTLDWNVQNPAMDKLVRIPVKDYNKNQLFIWGRNICQCGSIANSVKSFVQNLSANLKRYSVDGENHILNGILFEMYFDSHGELRQGKYKQHIKEEVLALRKDPDFVKSFEFICNLLKQYKDVDIYQPAADDVIIDVEIKAMCKKEKTYWGEEEFDVLESIIVNNKEYIEKLAYRQIRTEQDLKDSIANIICAPEKLVKIHSNVELSHELKIPMPNQEMANPFE